MSSALVAPRARAWVVAWARSLLRRSRCSRFLTVLASGTRPKSMISPGARRVASPSSSTSTSPPSSRLHQRASPAGSWQSTARAAMPTMAGACSLMSRSPPRSPGRGLRLARLGADQGPGAVGDPGEDDHGAGVAAEAQATGQLVDVDGGAALADLDGADAALAQDLAEALEAPGQGGVDGQEPAEGAAQGLVGGEEGDLGVELPGPEVAGQLLDQAGPGHGRAGVEQVGARRAARDRRAGLGGQGGRAGEDGGPAAGGGQGRRPEDRLLELAPVGQQ